MDRDTRSYKLVVEQQPLHARMCGFGEKDRRPMDPPPILKLIVREADGSLVNLSEPGSVDVGMFIVQADIYSADRSTECTMVASPSLAIFPPHSFTFSQELMGQSSGASSSSTNSNSSISTSGGNSESCYQYYYSSQPNESSNGGNSGSSMTVLKLAVQPSPPSSSQVPGHLSLPPPITSRNLTGAITASAALLRGLDGKLGIYFAFPDISVRTEGTYTLKFSFTILPIMHGQEMRPRQQTSSVQATVFSEHFTIYTAKRFPGMTGSTELSKILADQGLRIPLRKEPRVSGNSRRASDSSQNQSQSQHDVEMEDE